VPRIGHRYGEGREDRARRLGAAVLFGMGCTAASASPSHAFFISPLVECVTHDEQNNTVTAKFGYVSSSTIEEDLTIGSSNFFFPFPSARGQPTVFYTGLRHDVFSVTWDLSMSPR
jgi:hypothetical protein